jgi:long-chain acyl-CoA synthetase
VADQKRGERLVALVRAREGTSITRAGLIAHLRPALPLHKVPRVFATVPDWPTTRSGKTDFDSLRRLWTSGAVELLA